MLQAFKPLIVIGVIVGIISGAIVFAGELVTENRECISPVQVKELCFRNGIEINKCKVRKEYVVLPIGSR